MALNLFEILDTKPNIHWIEHSGNHAGMFILNNDKFLVSIDTIAVEDKLIADVGFKRNGSMDFVNDSVTPSKIIGAIVNSLSDRLALINPNVITIVVADAFGASKSRMQTYGFIARRLSWKGHIKFISDWIPFEHGHLMILGRTFSPSKFKMQEIVQRISLK